MPSLTAGENLLLQPVTEEGGGGGGAEEEEGKEDKHTQAHKYQHISMSKRSLPWPEKSFKTVRDLSPHKTQSAARKSKQDKN